MMNKLASLSLVTWGLISFSTFASGETKVYSDAGYPYKHLINKAESVKILFSEKESNVHCRVEVQWQGNTTTTQPVKITEQRFKNAPLTSCLLRTDAKALLATTYR